MSQQLELEMLDRNIKEAKEILDRRNALERLYKNKDFTNIIIKGYFEQEAIRLVHLKGAPDQQEPEKQTSIIRQMDAIAALSDFFRTLEHKAMLAEKAIESNEETRTAILEEEYEV